MMLKKSWITLWVTLWVKMGVTDPFYLLSQTGTRPWRPERKDAAAHSSFLFHVKLRRPTRSHDFCAFET